MSAWIVAPILVPGLAAPLLLLLRQAPNLQRRVSFAATALLCLASISLFVLATDGAVRPYLLGGWPAPFGIVLVLDRLSATMVLLSGILASAVMLHVLNGWDEKGHHFHPLFQFQLMGINGAFLTGDVFNLFVFFEVMLIASYGLLLHGGGPRRLGAGFQYVAIKLLGSTLFLFAVGIIYGVTGTLNMADLAGRVGQVAAGDAALLRTGALLLFMVFALKAALVPLHWWLPTAYAAAPAPVAALFAIMTKVGTYSIIRMFTLIFGTDGGMAASIAAPWIMPAALATLVIGAVGVLASRVFTDLVCFAVVWSMGSLLVAVALFDVEGLTAGLYYTLHSTLIAGALFLLNDLIASRRGRWRDDLEPSPVMANAALLGGLFFLAAVAMSGLPPLSGFIGKLMILDATRASSSAVWIWVVVLATSLLVIIGFGRAGTTLFWKSEAVEGTFEAQRSTGRVAPFTPAVFLILGTALLSVAAGPVTRHLEATARQVISPQPYIEAVLGPSTQPRPENEVR
ncbi:monovalent cation/H+ antiporter subunit D [Microvirga sp. KLBC 81]|uniref:monovalent cation/H+ antiporter subunit D n=1 Tax=Microvirga sp. KLBC 81 TaxID=1862707 RepID=UPI000D50DDC3|nr:monovalent cation/H+ antiporter subunit D [Microvirga sp. KLBC 81]PVE25458.1 monovalent cation/H+ antiporter subunit D [Microvirga sp. KLBC 81]